MKSQSKLFHLRKLIRFATIYGPRRAVVKALGRLRIGRGWSSFNLSRLPKVAFVGCGQFAFSTLGYFLRGKVRIVSCYDVVSDTAKSFGRMYSAIPVADVSAILTDPDISLIYIASNHASHTEYAVAALSVGKRVYVEKPVAVSFHQLSRLSQEVRKGEGRRIFAGYNRPFSGAVHDLKKFLVAPKGPLTLSCFVSGHVITPDHWYRNVEEGTRICGNVGHWLDLAVHMLSRQNLPNRWRIILAWSNANARDDDLAINLTSENGDLVNIVLTARSEPFEGINESINLQWDDVIAKIDDFRTMTLWQGDKVKRYRYWPKDVGHKRAVQQPFNKEDRPWPEIEDSSLLMLRIMEMIKQGKHESDFSFYEERLRLVS